MLRDDGITYHEYVTELTFLLSLKMAQEIGNEELLPEGWRWSDLEARDGLERLNYYRTKQRPTPPCAAACSSASTASC